jgi:hypothetical protein
MLDIMATRSRQDRAPVDAGYKREPFGKLSFSVKNAVAGPGPSVLGSRRVDAAGNLKPAPVAAPVTAAVIAVPLGQTFPLLAVGVRDETRIDGVLKRWSDEAVDYWDHLSEAALRAHGRFPGAR